MATSRGGADAAGGEEVGGAEPVANREFSESGRSVLFVSATGWLSGPGRSLLTLMANLPRSVHQILVAPANGDLLMAIRDRGVPVTHLPLFRRRGRIGKSVGRMTAILQLTSWIMRNRHRLAAIHANGYSELHLAALGAVLGRVPIVVWFHASEADPWDKRLGSLWGRVLARRRLIAVSDSAREVVVGTGLASSHQIAIVPNPIDSRDVLVSEDQAATLSHAQRLPVVGYLGSTLSDKGFDLLPDIIERARDMPLTWALFLHEPDVGAADDDLHWERLRAMSTDGRVSFPGRKSDVRDAYRECDIVICPSRRESFGRIAAEAMMNGLPVVASDIRPYRDLVGDVGGILFPVGDVGAAVTALAELVADPPLRAQLGRAARHRAARFEPGPIVRQFADLYGLTSCANETTPSPTP